MGFAKTKKNLKYFYMQNYAGMIKKESYAGITVSFGIVKIKLMIIGISTILTI